MTVKEMIEQLELFDELKPFAWEPEIETDETTTFVKGPQRKSFRNVKMDIARDQDFMRLVGSPRFLDVINRLTFALQALEGV